jgi:hypothetical protein
MLLVNGLNSIVVEQSDLSKIPFFAALVDFKLAAENNETIDKLETDIDLKLLKIILSS